MKSYRSESNRLKPWDYANSGWYYITVCTKNKRCLFGNIKCSEMILSKEGKIANDNFKAIPQIFNNVDIDEFVIMPNHIHAIIIIERRDLINQISTSNWILMKNPELTLGKIIRHYKAKTTRMIKKHVNKNFSWQPNYYDHIIRNEDDLHRIRHYIKYNPLKWLDDDQLYPEN